ncbi:pyridoxal phosphate-dependent decarboxylase family protein [Peribacillus frigoritolerans]|uniref:pyridoxal phosphate-dependent decarboxylase family protein n=1 Tax=Peribacillus castrilensis TaxID=2897690 RepID=UPI002DCA8E84|nr:aspartate aminotransferase family protein [Peribacillus castrilensis]MEC0347087.1 aspartate aminotransferase family protein [Peribacillus castrilensis]
MNETINKTDFAYSQMFLNNEEGFNNYSQSLKIIEKKLTNFLKGNHSPYSGKKPYEIEARLSGLPPASLKGETLEAVADELAEFVINDSINVHSPACIGHLHCPTLIPAVAAEMVIGTLNQSMDSWDQSSAATFVEERLIDWLCSQVGLPEQADGIFTSGGTQSNYMGLLLARDAYCKKFWGVDVQQHGLPVEANKLRILCSEAAHFTVRKSAAQLGLGEQAVITVKTDANHRLSIDELNHQMLLLEKQGLLPFAIVATCGTTDFGSIDPLHELSDAARKNGIWLHVDAAYGGAMILSKDYKDLISGIERADSITVDFHKLFYQPISCGAFLVSDSNSFQYIQHHADYLNPQEDEAEGMVHLVNKSVQTTRRFDALKLWMSLKVVGLETFAEMIDYTCHLAREVAVKIDKEEGFTVLNKAPELNAVVFRYNPEGESEQLVDLLNKQIQQELLKSGRAFLAKTRFEGQVYLKMTLLNPMTRIEHIEDILDEIRVLGEMFKMMEE